jgi:hypothetical protein
LFDDRAEGAVRCGERLRRGWERRLEYAPFLLLSTAVLAFCLAMPLLRVGDAADYVLGTESLWFDHDLRYTREDLLRHLDLKPAGFDSPAGLHTAVGRDGAVWLGAHHSFYYSVVALPFYAAFGYRGFYLANGFLFCLFALCLYWHLRRFNAAPTAWAWLLLALVFSASWTYVAWIHAEVFYMALVGFALYLWRSGRPVWAALPLGLAAGAQPILALLLPGILFLVWQERPRPQRWREIAAMAAVLALAALPQELFNLYAFGRLHPMLGTETVGWGYVSWGRFVRSWLDPAAGIVWFYPAIGVALLEAPRNRRTGVLVLSALVVILGSGVSIAWFSHQVGLRYGSYVFPLFLFLVEKVDLARPRALLAWCAVVFAGTGLAINPIGNSAMSPREKTFLPFALARQVPGFRENRDVLWNRLVHLGPSVAVEDLWPDGWIPGGEEVTCQIAARPLGAVELTVAPWPAAMGRAQRLKVRTLTRAYEIPLPAGRVTRVPLPLVPGDFLDDPSGGQGTIRVRLRAEGWSPFAFDSKGNDYRRLGVCILEVRQAGVLLYRR